MAAVQPSPFLITTPTDNLERLASSGNSRRHRHSRCLDTYTNTERLAGFFILTHGISLTLFLPATSATIHILLVSFFADEERQRLDELQVQARAVFFRRNST